MRKKLLLLIVGVLAFGLGYMVKPPSIRDVEINYGKNDEHVKMVEEVSEELIWQEVTATVIYKVIRGDSDGKHYEVVVDVQELGENFKLAVSALEYRIISKEDLIDILYIQDKAGDQAVFHQWLRDDVGKLKIHWDRPVAVVDAGHGGYELGEGSNDLWIEKNMNLKIADVMKSHLESVGVRVIMTRTKDEYVGLYDRIAIANYVEADIMISNHLNRMDGKASGVEVLYSSHSDRTVAKALAGAISTEEHEVFRVYYRRGAYPGSDYYALHRYTEVPSYIIEYAFSDNEKDSAFVIEHWEEMAGRAAEAVAMNLLGQ